MELALTSTQFTPESTEGMIDIDGVFECYSLELPYSDGLPGGAIPPGRYPIRLRPSPHFVQLATFADVDQVTRDFFNQYAWEMPHIDEIPGRSLIMLHPGNFPKDVKGCVCVGTTKGLNFLTHSRQAFAQLHPKIRIPARNGNCFITVAR